MGDSGVGEGRVQRRRARHRERLLDVAEEMFASQAYSSVLIDEIADRVDLSVGTVYSHFGSKDEIFQAVAERALAKADGSLVLAAGSDDDPLARLVATGSACLDLLIESPSLARYLLAPPVPPTEVEAADRLKRRVAALYDTLASAIRDCMSRNIIQPVDADQLATFLVASWSGMVASVASPIAAPADYEQARAAVEQASAILVRGLVRESGPGDAPALVVPRQAVSDGGAAD